MSVNSLIHSAPALTNSSVNPFAGISHESSSFKTFTSGAITLPTLLPYATQPLKTPSSTLRSAVMSTPDTEDLKGYDIEDIDPCDSDDTASRATSARSVATTITSLPMEEEHDTQPFQMQKHRHPGKHKRTAKKRKGDSLTAAELIECEKDYHNESDSTNSIRHSAISAQQNVRAQSAQSINSKQSPSTPDNEVSSTASSVKTAAAAATVVKTTENEMKHIVNSAAPKPRVVYTKLDLSSLTENGSSSKAALLITLAPLDSKSTKVESQLRQRAINTLGRYKNNTQQQQRAWCEFVTAILDETKNTKLAKDLLRTAQLPSQLSSYKSDPFAFQQQDANNMVTEQLDEKANTSVINSAATAITASTTTAGAKALNKKKKRQYHTPRAFFKNTDAAYASSNAVFAVAHFHQAATMKYIAEKLYQLLQNNGIHFLRLEEKAADTEYFSVRFQHTFDESKPFEEELERLRTTLQSEALLKDFHFDQRTLDYDFFDPRTQRTIPQLYVAKGNEALLDLPFFAGRDVEVFVQPAMLCFGCGINYTNAISRHCHTCTQSRRRQSALQANAGGVTEIVSDSFCFKCIKRVPNSHIDSCENQAVYCLRCHSSQHTTLRCPLLRGRFVPLSDLSLSQHTNSDTRSTASRSTQSQSQARSGTSRYTTSQHTVFQPLAVPAAATTKATLAANSGSTQSTSTSYAAVVAAAAAASSESGTTRNSRVSPPIHQSPSPPVDNAVREAVVLHSPTGSVDSPGAYLIRQQIQSEMQPVLKFLQEQSATQTALLQAIQRLGTPPQPSVVPPPPTSFTRSQEKDPFETNAIIRELRDMIAELRNDLAELRKENAELRRQLAVQPNSVTAQQQQQHSQRTPKLIRRRNDTTSTATSSIQNQPNTPSATVSELLSLTTVLQPPSLPSTLSSPARAPSLTSVSTPGPATASSFSAYFNTKLHQSQASLSSNTLRTATGGPTSQRTITFPAVTRHNQPTAAAVTAANTRSSPQSHSTSAPTSAAAVGQNTISDLSEADIDAIQLSPDNVPINTNDNSANMDCTNLNNDPAV